MRFNENNLIAEAYAKVNEAKKKPSAGLTKKQKSDVVKKARAGKDIGKKGSYFDKMAKAAGGGEKGKKIAAAAMWKSVKRESAGIASVYGTKLLNESVSSEQYDEIVSIIHDAVNTAARSNPELSREISQVWDVVTNIWADNEMQVYNTIIDEAYAKEMNEEEMGEESDPMIPKVEKILQKMTEEYGSEELAVEELSKWDEDEMNEYYNNHIVNEEPQFSAGKPPSQQYVSTIGHSGKNYFGDKEQKASPGAENKFGLKNDDGEVIGYVSSRDEAMAAVRTGKAYSFFNKAEYEASLK